jgi:tetratricopeptide (TPR) repeat protein
MPSPSALSLLIQRRIDIGKTVHCQRIIAKAAEEGQKVILSYWFGRTGGRPAACAQHFAISLLWQLFRNQEVAGHPEFASFLRSFRPLLNTHQDARHCQVESLLCLLTRALELAGKFLIVVDALDECIEDAEILQDYLYKVGCQPDSRLIVSARDKFFSQDSNIAISLFRLDRNIIEPDIVRFLEYRVRGNPKFTPKRADILKTIQERSQGIFLLARLLIDDLGTAESVNEQIEKMNLFGDRVSDEYQRQFCEHEKKLLENQRRRRDNILRWLLAARTSPSVQLISEALALNESTGAINEHDIVFEPARDITYLCRPLVEVGGKDHVVFIRSTAKEFLLKDHLTMLESDLFLARKCLIALRQEKYRSSLIPAQLLRKHLLKDTIYRADTTEGLPKGSALYDYATLNFQDHVTELTDPPEDIIANLAGFLLGIEFVSWSEYLLDLTKQSSLGNQIKVYSTLLNWTKQLSASINTKVPIAKYFEVAHATLSASLRDRSGDNILQYLPLVRNGNYFNGGGQSAADWQRAYNYKKKVVAGFTEILGPGSPVTLRYRAALLQEYFWQKRFFEVRQQLIKVAGAQRLLGGAGEADLATTLWLLGLACHSLTRFEEALEKFDEAANGIMSRSGKYDRQYLLVGLYKGHTLEQLLRLDEARVLYGDVKETLTPIVGSANGFTLMCQTAVGAVQRKQRHYKQARKNLLEGWDGRKKIFSIDVNVCLDAAVQVALLYRDDQEGELCLDLLDDVSESTVYQEDFERYCQTQHIRALVAFDKGDFEKPLHDLLQLVHKASGANRKANNRELMWVRETAAEVMRHLGQNDEALMLFSNLVKPTEEGRGGPSDKPEPLSHLRMAEKAVHLVRQGRTEDAQKLLQDNGLRWIREADFYILSEGGPIADTAIISPINFPTHALD